MKIYFAPAPTANYTKKKVWSRSFIWMEVLVNLESNKQYPTLVQYGVKIHIPIQVMSAIAFLDSLKFTRFPSKDKSETLSSIICLPVIRQDKDRKCFRKYRTQRGIVPQISGKDSEKSILIREFVFLAWGKHGFHNPTKKRSGANTPKRRFTKQIAYSRREPSEITTS